MTTNRDESGVSFGANPSASPFPHEEVNRSTDGVVNPLGQSVNPDSASPAVPLIRDGAPGARGWMDGSGRFLLGPYAGHRMLDIALMYAQQGWYVFQIRMGTKGGYYANCSRCNPRSDQYDKEAHESGTGACAVHPDGYGRCHGFHAATRNPDVIRQWWTENPHGNIGIDCGRSGIALIDVDIKHHLGKTGDQSIAELESRHGAFPRGPRAVTASGGWHWVFALPGDHELRSSTGYTDANGVKHGLADYVDIKAVGGLMVAAPSLVYDDSKGIVTGQYVWDPDTEGEIPDLPRWVVQEIERREQRNKARPTMSLSFGPKAEASADEVRAQVMRLADEVAATGAGGRNAALLRNAGKCFQYAEAGQIPHAEVEFIFEQAARASGLDESDMRTIGNARRRAEGNPRPWLANFGAPEARAQYDQWKRVPAPRAAETENTTATATAVATVVDTEDTDDEPDVTVLVGGGDGGTIGSGDDEDAAPADDRMFLDAVRRYLPDQLNQARYFCEEDGARLVLRWNLSAGAFMKYDLDKGHWRQDDTKHTLTGADITRLGIRITDATERDIKFSPEMETLVRARYGEVTKEEARHAKKVIDAKRAWPKVYNTAAGQSGIITFTRTIVDQCTALDFDKSSGLLNFANGTYDVTTGTLRQHTMHDMLTHRVPYELDMTLADKPLNEVAPHFHRLITRMCAAPGEVSPEAHEKRVAAMMRLFGYTLHGSNPEKKLAVLVGGTNIGKNQAVEVVGQLLGNQLAWLGARPQLLIEGKGERHDADEYGLAGRRLVLVNEMKEGQILDEGQVLRFVGPEGTQVALRRMRQDREDHWITWKLIITTNELPRSRMTPQILGRLIVVPLSEVPVPDTEQYDIKAAIMAHEGPAVLAHLVAEWRTWYVTKMTDHSPTGLVVTDDMTEARETYRTSNRPLALEFFDECTERGEGIPMTPSSEFWSRFQVWLRQEHPNLRKEDYPGRNAFYADIRALDGQDGIEAVTEHKGGGRYQFRGLRGVRLLPQTMAELSQRAF